MENKTRITKQELTDGLTVITLNEDGNKVIAEGAGRDIREAAKETVSKLFASIEERTFIPRGCIYNPHRDY